MTEKIEATYQYIGTTRNDEIPVWMQVINKGRQKIGSLDPLGWGTSPGPGVPA